MTRRRKGIPTREQTLLQIVFMMWRELQKPAAQQDPDGLEAEIRAAGHGWALPAADNLHPDTLLTANEVADRLGIRPSTVRDWPTRYGLKQHVNGTYRWGDIEALRTNTRTRV